MRIKELFEKANVRDIDNPEEKMLAIIHYIASTNDFEYQGPFCLHYNELVRISYTIIGEDLMITLVYTGTIYSFTKGDFARHMMIEEFGEHHDKVIFDFGGRK